MWVFNVFLYLCFLFSPKQYDASVAAGAPCYSYVANLGDDSGAQPICWYDPTNQNLGK